MSRVEKWLRKASGGASQRKVAEHMGVQPSTVSRWLSDDRLPADMAIALARAYDCNPLEALREMGIFTREEFEGAVAPPPLEDVPELEMLEELTRRARMHAAEGSVVARIVESLGSSAPSIALSPPEGS